MTNKTTWLNDISSFIEKYQDENERRKISKADYKNFFTKVQEHKNLDPEDFIQEEKKILISTSQLINILSNRSEINYEKKMGVKEEEVNQLNQNFSNWLSKKTHFEEDDQENSEINWKKYQWWGFVTLLIVLLLIVLGIIRKEFS